MLHRVLSAADYITRNQSKSLNSNKGWMGWAHCSMGRSLAPLVYGPAQPAVASHWPMGRPIADWAVLLNGSEQPSLKHLGQSPRSGMTMNWLGWAFCKAFRNLERDLGTNFLSFSMSIKREVFWSEIAALQLPKGFWAQVMMRMGSQEAQAYLFIVTGRIDNRLRNPKRLVLF